MPWRRTRHFPSNPALGDWGFNVFEDRTDGTVEEIGKGILKGDGHCTYLPGNRWVLNDTYRDKNNIQHPYLFNTQTQQRVELGEICCPMHT